MTRAAAFLALAAPLLAAPAPPEVVREESYNYRIVGELPRGWQRRPGSLAFVFAIDEIPHAYVHIVRDRLAGPVDVAEELRRRAPQYRFPGAAAGGEEVKPEKWIGRDAFLLEHEATVNGVRCRRRVVALVASGVWYERIETIYGDATDAIPSCREGLDLFRQGFRLLVEPLAEAERTDPAERPIESRDFGFRIVKPEGFLRKEVDLESDPGLRVAMEARLPDPRNGAVVRIFEYGLRERLDAKAWLDTFFGGFASHCARAERAKAEAPAVPGAAEASAERFTGERDGRPVEELVLLVRAESGRVLCLRIRTSGSAAEALKPPLSRLLSSFQANG